MVVVSGGGAACGGTDMRCFLGRVVVTLCWACGLGRALLGLGSLVRGLVLGLAFGSCLGL